MSKKRKERLIELHTTCVLEVAEELFEKKGFDAVSMDEVAFNTGISKSTVYVYFKSKQIIWDSIVCKYMELLLEDAKKAAEGQGKKDITGSALISLISSKSTRCSAKERSARSQLTRSRNFIRKSIISASRRTRRSQDSSGVA